MCEILRSNLAMLINKPDHNVKAQFDDDCNTEFVGLKTKAGISVYVELKKCYTGKLRVWVVLHVYYTSVYKQNFIPCVLVVNYRNLSTWTQCVCVSVFYTFEIFFVILLRCIKVIFPVQDVFSFFFHGCVSMSQRW